jgi:hypothetical protein
MITINPWYLMMQRLGAEMAGFSVGAGENFPKWAGYKSQAFLPEEGYWLHTPNAASSSIDCSIN